jgi:hypothetical protein
LEMINLIGDREIIIEKWKDVYNQNIDAESDFDIELDLSENGSNDVYFHPKNPGRT